MYYDMSSRDQYYSLLRLNKRYPVARELDAAPPNQDLCCSSCRNSSRSSRCRTDKSFGMGTWKRMYWSPITPECTSLTPRPRSLTCSPCCVPLLTLTVVSPSSVGTVTVPPSAAIAMLTSTSVARCGPSREKRLSCSTARMTYRCPFGRFRSREGRPSCLSWSFIPSSAPAGTLMFTVRRLLPPLRPAGISTSFRQPFTASINES
mmetsp:Transcript_1437/g.5299  ORF Transcript_1437/g.5299 Transcript_1437/m.5299 type:complete len:205 (+) Transcript_1437:689-1303(+)